MNKYLIVLTTTSMLALALSACARQPALTRQAVGFDRRSAFNVITNFPVEQEFPFSLGQQIDMAVYFMPNLMQEWVRQELSPQAIQVMSVVPNGLPDPEDPYRETILAEFSPAGQPEQKVVLPWRVGHEDILVAVLEYDKPPGPLDQAAIGDWVPATIRMEIRELELLEAIPEGGMQLWRMNLVPAGEAGESLIVGEAIFAAP